MTGDLRAHVDAILSASGDPSRGLSLDVFRMVSSLVPLVNVDLLIQDDRARTLLTWREDELFGTGWHVPGGIIRYKETLADRIAACAREELGADVVAAAAPLEIGQSIAAHRVRGHHISLLFRCRLVAGPDPGGRAGEPPRAGQWQWHERTPADLLPGQRHYATWIG